MLSNVLQGGERFWNFSPFFFVVFLVLHATFLPRRQITVSFQAQGQRQKFNYAMTFCVVSRCSCRNVTFQMH